MGLFREYIREVRTPIRYGCLCENVLLDDLCGDGDFTN